MFLCGNVSAQTTLSDIQEKIVQNFTWEAKKEIDEMLPQALADSLLPRTSVFLTKGMVYDALVRESTVSQDVFLEEALSAYRDVLALAVPDSAHESAYFQAEVRLKALFAFLNNKAVEAHLSKNVEKAMLYYKMALRLQPKNKKLLKNLLSLAWEVKDYATSKLCIFSLFRSEDFDVNYFKMLLYIEGEVEKNFSKALKICQEAQHHHPKDTTFFFAKVNYLALTNDFFAALELLEPLSEHDNPQIINNLAFLHKQIGRLQDAEKCWKKLHEINPKDQSPIYNIAEMYFNQGINYLKQAPKYMITTAPNPYFERAKPYLEALYEENPKDEKIKEAYKRAKAEAKQPLKRAGKKEKVLQPSAPTILLTAPSFEADTFFTNNVFVKIEGLLIDEDGGAEVNINGIIGTVENDRFSVIVPLRSGLNALDIKGTNFDGITAEKRIFVFRNENKPAPKNYLLLFGTDEYEKQVATKGHALNLYRLDSILLQSYENFSRLNTYRLIGKDAVKEKLIAAIRELARISTPEDNVIFAFSGKSHDFSPNYDTYLQTYTSEENGTDLSASFIIELFKTVAARNQLMIFDCKLGKNFTEKAERSSYAYVENFGSRKVLSAGVKAKEGELLKALCVILEEEDNLAFYGYDLFFEINLQKSKVAEYQYLITDRAEGGDLQFRKKLK